MAELKQVNLKVDPDLWYKARVEAFRLGMDLKDFVALCLQDKLKAGGN